MSKLRQLLLERAEHLSLQIALPEASDPRVLSAARRIQSQTRIRPLMVLTNGQKPPVGLASIHAEPSELDAQEYVSIRGAHRLDQSTALSLLQSALQFAVWLNLQQKVDGVVAGAIHPTADVVRTILHILGAEKGGKVSAAMLMDPDFIDEKFMVLADIALMPEPSAEDLAMIALASTKTASAFGLIPRVALLSYATGQSASGGMIDKINAATKAAQGLMPNTPIDGPLQFDAAVNPLIAAQKAPNSAVAGKANVLIFPDLNAGNIGYKAIQQANTCSAIGPLIQGANGAVNDLSRGASEDDIFYTILATAIQAQAKR